MVVDRSVKLKRAVIAHGASIRAEEQEATRISSVAMLSFAMLPCYIPLQVQ